MPRAALLVLLLLLGPARTDVISLEDRGAILQLSGDELTKRTFRFSGILKLTLLVEGGPDLEVEAPDIEVNPGEWVLVSQSKGETTTLEKGKRRWRKEVELDPIAPVKLTLPVIVLRHRHPPEREWITSRWEGVVIEVVGPAPEENPTVRGQLPIEPVPPGPGSHPFPTSEVIAVGMVLAALGALAWWCSRPGVRPALPADQRALGELQRLSAQVVIAAPGTTHLGVSVVVRRYVEERFGVQAPRQTTEELLQAARACDSLSPDALAELESLLGECDRVKFTGVMPAREDSEAVVTQACQFVRDTSVVPAS